MSDDLLDGDGLLADTGDFDEDLDGDAEDALLADDTTYSDHYNLRAVPTSGRDVYIESNLTANTGEVSARSNAADTIYQEVEDVVEGDVIIDDDEEDVLDLGVTDEFENELQDHPHNSSAAPVWIKQEKIDKDNLSSLVVSNRLHSVHCPDSHRSGPTIKQEPHDVDTTDVKHASQQPNVVVTSSTEVLQNKYPTREYPTRVNESDEEENNDDEELRDRFKTERTNVISLKTTSVNKWGEIPDSLDSVVTQQFNQQKGCIPTRGGGARRGGRLQPSQQHPSSHKIHINPHFKKDQHPQPVHPSPWENQVPVQQQPSYDSPIMQHNAPPLQHYGLQHPPPQAQHPPPHQVQPQPLPTGPPQIFHQQPPPPIESVHPQPPHLPQHQPPPGPWIRNEGPPQPPAQPHFDSQYSMQQQHHGPPQQPYYQQRGPLPPNNAMYPQQQPPYEQNIVQQHHPHPPPPHPHQHQPGYEYQQMQPQRLLQPPPPGAEDSVVQGSPVRTVQFSRNSQQITVQMSGNREIPSHYNSNQEFNNIVRPPHPQQQNNWINTGLTPPSPQQQQLRPPHFIQPGHRLPHSPQQLPPRMQVPRGQHPRFMRGNHFRRGVVNRHPHPRHPHSIQGDMQHVAHTGGPGGDGLFVGPPGGGIGKRLGDMHQSPVVPFKQARFSNSNNINVQQPGQQQLQHVRKGPVMSNLCEVPTVDNVPDTTTKIEQMEDEDEETREYRLKIAEQKRLREKLLKQKEMRRQMAAVKKQQEIQLKRSNDTPVQQYNNVNINSNNNNNNIPTTTSVINQPQQHQQQYLQNQQQMNVQRVSVHQRIGEKVPVQPPNVVQGSPITGYRIVRVRAKDGSILIKKVPVNKEGQLVIQRRLQPLMRNPPQQIMHHQNQHQFQPNQHNQQAGSFVVPTINRRIVVDNVAAHKQQNLIKGNYHVARKRGMKKNMNPVTTIIPTKPAAQAMTLGQRFSMQASQQQQQADNKVDALNNQQLQQPQPSARSNRKVITSGNAYNVNIHVTASPPGPVSHTVVVDNLTASTSKEQLIKMARQVGEVEKLNLEPQLKRATITFKNTNSAGAFYLKFQRKMVDLSMINVSIAPE